MPPWRSKNCTSNSRTCPADTPAFGPVYRRAPCRPSLLMISALSTNSLLPSSDESENWYVPDLGAVTHPRNRAQNSWQKWPAAHRLVEAPATVRVVDRLDHLRAVRRAQAVEVGQAGAPPATRARGDLARRRGGAAAVASKRNFIAHVQQVRRWQPRGLLAPALRSLARKKCENCSPSSQRSPRPSAAAAPGGARSPRSPPFSAASARPPAARAARAARRACTVDPCNPDDEGDLVEEEDEGDDGALTDGCTEGGCASLEPGRQLRPGRPVPPPAPPCCASCGARSAA